MSQRRRSKRSHCVVPRCGQGTKNRRWSLARYSRSIRETRWMVGVETRKILRRWAKVRVRASARATGSPFSSADGRIGVDLVQEQVAGRQRAQSDRAVRTRHHQDPAREFLGEHGVAAVAAAGRGNPLAQARVSSIKWRPAGARTASPAPPSAGPPAPALGRGGSESPASCCRPRCRRPAPPS